MCANKSKPIVVDAEKIQVTKKLYKTIRSFMDSFLYLDPVLWTCFLPSTRYTQKGYISFT